MPRKARNGVDYATVVSAALSLPAVEESTSYGTPALKVRGKMMTRLWEDGETLVLKMSWAERERWLLLEPATFFLTDHYRGSALVLVRLQQAWEQAAPKTLLAKFAATQGEGDRSA